MQQHRASLERIEIVQTDTEVHITYADEREQILTTDNKKAAIETPSGEGTVRARWRDDGGLVVKTKTDRRKTTETYYVTKDGRMLTVLVAMESQGPMGDVSFKRIYRPVDPDAQPDSEPGDGSTAGPAAG